MPDYCPAEFTFTVSYNTATQHVQARWRGNVPDADLYAHYAELMATAEAHGNCRFWLLDMDGRNWPTFAFRHWFGTEFAPLIHAALHQPVFMAYVVSDSQNVQINTPSIQTIQYHCVTHDVYPLFFTSEAAACDWLLQQQAHDTPPPAQPTGR